MTSKEFLRRKSIYAKFDECAFLFLSNPRLDYVYRVSLCITKSVSTFYVAFISLDRFDDSALFGCDYISFDRFTRAEFNIQLGYFLAFVHRLSSYQLGVLKSSRCCNNLFSYALKYKDANS